MGVKLVERLMQTGEAVTTKKDDAAADDQAAIAKVAVSMYSACDGGMIQITSG